MSDRAKSRQQELALLGLTAYAVDDSFVKCPMCRERYTSPRMLKCLHTFCEHCVTVHIQHAAKNKQVCQPTFPVANIGDQNALEHFY